MCDIKMFRTFALKEPFNAKTKLKVENGKKRTLKFQCKIVKLKSTNTLPNKHRDTHMHRCHLNPFQYRGNWLKKDREDEMKERMKER